MWMSVLIILVCIQRTITIEAVSVNGRIKQENNEQRNQQNSKDESIEQYDPGEAEYEDEDLADDPKIDMNKPSIKKGTEGENFDFKNNNINNYSLPSLPKLQEIMRLVRSALPTDNSSKIDDTESDMEEDEEFEDTESNISTEEQEESETYDNAQSGKKGKSIAVSDRSKRLTVNAKKGITTSKDLIENGEDESLNENDGQYYADFSPTRKESMTVRSRLRRVTSRKSAYRELPSASSRHLKGGLLRDNIQVVSDSVENKQMTKKSVLHGRKGKLPRNKEKSKLATKNGENDFEELKKAYNALVCSVENFMGLANKTVNRGEETNSSMSSSGNNSSTVYNATGTGIPNKNASSTTICVPTLCKNDSSLHSTVDWCVTSSSTMECMSEESDLDIKKSDDEEEINSHMKKKQKGLKMEYPLPDDLADKSGAYVYNDYDSVDPNEYDTNITSKSTMSPSTLTSHPKSVATTQTTESLRSEKYKETKNMSPSTTSVSFMKDLSTTSKSSYSPNETSKESTITWTTFHYDTKIKLRPSRRQARRMSTDFQKILSRRRYLNRQKKQPESLKEEFTDHPISRNVPPSHQDDTEIIEVEYV